MSFPLSNLLPALIRQPQSQGSLIHQVLGNAGWLFADRGIRLFVGLFVSAWIARYLGPEEYGLFSYALAFTALFGIFSTLGLDPIIVRELAADPLYKQEILGSALALRISGAALGIVMTTFGILALRGPHDAVIPLVFISSAAFLFQAFDCIDLWFQATQRNRLSVTAKTIVFVIATGVRVILLLYKAPLVAFISVILFEAVLSASALIWVYTHDREQILAWRVRYVRVRELLSEGFPLFVAGLAVMIYMRLDQIMLGEMLGERAVGIYAAAAKVVEMSFMLPSVLMVAAIPAIVKLREKGHGQFRVAIQRMFSALVTMAYVIALGVCLAAGLIVEVLFGEEFKGAAGILRIQIWSLVFVSLSVASGHYLTLEKHGYVVLERAVISAVANIGLNCVLIPKYHLLGAAWAMLLSHAIASFCLFRTPAARECLRMMLRSLLPYYVKAR